MQGSLLRWAIYRELGLDDAGLRFAISNEFGTVNSGSVEGVPYAGHGCRLFNDSGGKHPRFTFGGWERARALSGSDRPADVHDAHLGVAPAPPTTSAVPWSTAAAMGLAASLLLPAVYRRVLADFDFVGNPGRVPLACVVVSAPWTAVDRVVLQPCGSPPRWRRGGMGDRSSMVIHDVAIRATCETHHGPEPLYVRRPIFPENPCEGLVRALLLYVPSRRMFCAVWLRGVACQALSSAWADCLGTGRVAWDGLESWCLPHRLGARYDPPVATASSALRPSGTQPRPRRRRRSPWEARWIFEALDPQVPIGVTMERIGIGTDSLPAVNRLRVLLASSAFPFLRAV